MLLRPSTWIVLGKAAMLPHATLGEVFALAYLGSPPCSCVPPSGMLLHSPTWIVRYAPASHPRVNLFPRLPMDSPPCSCVPPSGILLHSPTWIVLGKAAMLPLPFRKSLYPLPGSLRECCCYLAVYWIVFGNASMPPVLHSGKSFYSPTWIVLGKAAMLPHAALGEVNAADLHIVQGEGQEVRGPLSLIQPRIYIKIINQFLEYI
jgi:hypothetical protein